MKQGKLVIICIRSIPPAVIGSELWDIGKHSPNISGDSARQAIIATDANVLTASEKALEAVTTLCQPMFASGWLTSAPEAVTLEEFAGVPPGTSISILLAIPNSPNPNSWTWKRTSATRKAA